MQNNQSADKVHPSRNESLAREGIDPQLLRSDSAAPVPV